MQCKVIVIDKWLGDDRPLHAGILKKRKKNKMRINIYRREFQNNTNIASRLYSYQKLSCGFDIITE